MQKLLLGLLLGLGASCAFAQRDALIEYNDQWNMFSKFELGYASMADDGGMIGGVSAGGLLNDRLAIGLGGHMLIDSIETGSDALGEIGGTDLWYLGFYTEYVFGPEKLVYGSIKLLVGGGQLDVASPFGGSSYGSNMFIAEPGINLMVNVTETFSMGLGVSYRFTEGVDIPELDDGDISGLTGSIFLRFTEF